MDDCNKVSDHQLHEDDSAERNYKLNAIYADTYMKYVNLLATDFFVSNFSTPCIQNVSNTETKQGSIMK